MVKAQDSTIKSSVKNVEAKVDSVLTLMTLEEKVGQLVQYNGSWDLTGPASEMNNKQKEENLKAGKVGAMLNVLSVDATREAQKLVMENSRLKIPLMFGYDVIHGYTTIFPVPLAETASWDLEAMERTAEIAALESAANGVNWTFSPMIDVSRDARWGRIMEGSGEDPYLTSKVAVAKVKGYQSEDLANPRSIAATAKHFAGYGFGEAGRDYNTVHIGENELHNTILPPFKAAADAGVATFMNAFNDLDGIPATGHKTLQRDILKRDWDWNGFVVSDWGSIPEMIAHGVAKNKKEAAKIALNAGSDMDMEGGAYESSLVDLVKEGEVSEDYINDAVKRVLRVKFKLGLFDDPYLYSNPELLENISFEEASGLPLTGLTAIQALEKAGLKEDDRILIHAGSGGVGSFAIQYAKAKGAIVYTTTSSKNVDWVKALGADRVIDYKEEDYKEVANNLDIVFDTLGDDYTFDAFKIIKKGGVVTSIVGPPDEESAKIMGIPDYKLPEQLSNLIEEKSIAYKHTWMQPNAAQLKEIKTMVEEGNIKPTVDLIYEFEDGIDEDYK